MKKFALAAALLASAGFASSAQAASSSATIAVSAEVTQACEMANPPSSASLSNEVPVFTTTVSVYCNYDGNFNSKITSANGGFVNSANPNAKLVDYALYFGAPEPGDVHGWNNASIYKGGLVSQSPAGSVYANYGKTTWLGFGLKDKIYNAGSYSDTVTIEVIP